MTLDLPSPTLTRETITIDPRYRGPSRSGNGGYVCGRLASWIAGPARVRLCVPPPLGVELEVRRSGERVALLEGETIVAVARPAEVSLEVPDPPGFDDAVEASRRFPGFASHWFPGCFVCGPDRSAGDGLRIFPGPVEGRALVAAPWMPGATLAAGDGAVPAELLWAALDCPGAFCFPAPAEGVVLLGELAVALRGSVTPGERCVLLAWEIGRDGRKHHTGTALYDASGTCRGVGRAIWFEAGWEALGDSAGG